MAVLAAMASVPKTEGILLIPPDPPPSSMATVGGFGFPCGFAPCMPVGAKAPDGNEMFPF